MDMDMDFDLDIDDMMEGPSIFFIITTIMVIAIFIFVAVVIVRNMRKKSDTFFDTNIENTPNQIPKETETYCEYCGGSIPQGKGECPYCGAKKRKK